MLTWRYLCFGLSWRSPFVRSLSYVQDLKTISTDFMVLEELWSRPYLGLGAHPPMTPSIIRVQNENSLFHTFLCPTLRFNAPQKQNITTNSWDRPTGELETLRQTSWSVGDPHDSTIPPPPSALYMIHHLNDRALAHKVHGWAPKIFSASRRLIRLCTV